MFTEAMLTALCLLMVVFVCVFVFYVFTKKEEEGRRKKRRGKKEKDEETSSEEEESPVQSQSAAVVHEGLTPEAVPNDGPQLAKGEGTSTGKVKATVAGSSQPTAAPWHCSGRSRGTQGAQSRHKRIAHEAAKRPPHTASPSPRAGGARHALTKRDATQPAGLTSERGGQTQSEEVTAARCRLSADLQH